MNNKGQVLIAFVLLTPIMIMLTALIIDTGILYIDKRKLDYTVRDAVTYAFSDTSLDKVDALLKKNINNNLVSEINIEDNVVRICASYTKKSVFAYLFNKDGYEFNTCYKGTKDDNGIKIVRD